MKKWAALYFLLVGLILCIAYTGRGPEVWAFIYTVPWADKICHFLLIGLLAFLVNLLMNGRRLPLGKGHLLLGSFLVGVAVTGEEFFQLSSPARTFSWSDLLADYAGILFFGWCARWYLRTRAPQVAASQLHANTSLPGGPS